MIDISVKYDKDKLTRDEQNILNRVVKYTRNATLKFTTFTGTGQKVNNLLIEYVMHTNKLLPSVIKINICIMLSSGLIKDFSYDYDVSMHENFNYLSNIIEGTVVRTLNGDN